MYNRNSQEQTIYRVLAGQIQAGFYSDEERFPSLQEIARQYGVSYCPAQRAMKKLERGGLIQLQRGGVTKVLAKPCENYLQSELFFRRREALHDLFQSLLLLAPSLCAQGLHQLATGKFSAGALQGKPFRQVYEAFELLLRTLENQTALKLYYDLFSFIQKAPLEMLEQLYGKRQAGLVLEQLAARLLSPPPGLADGHYAEYEQRAAAQLEHFWGLLEPFFDLQEAAFPPLESEPDSFVWEPNQGRAKHCDVIGIDLLCKIHQGVYPVGTLLPNNAVLADIYHVSPITIRRTLVLLNKLSVAQTLNGVGTRVVFAGELSVTSKLKDLTMDHNLRVFLEALHLLAITCEAVMQATFPYITGALAQEIIHAAGTDGEKKALDSVIGTCMQVIVRCCPYAALREIYGKLTLLLLRGSVLRLSETGAEQVEGWPQQAALLVHSLEAKDGACFARTLGQLAKVCFVRTKQLLCELELAGKDALPLFIH